MENFNDLSNTLKVILFRLKNNPLETLKEGIWLIVLLLIIVFSFLLDLFALSQYPISYGPDGPFYNIQVRNIIRTALPDSNDPPLVYYYLVPFVLLIGDYTGIKVGMALIGSLMAIPAFLLTETFTKKIEFESRVPALLSAFLITINVYYFRMIEDFMQNLVGVFFLLWFLFFIVRWFESMHDWKKYGILTVLFLILTILTHVYPTGVLIILFGSLFIFNIIVRSIKTRTLPKQDLKTIGALTAATVAVLIPVLVLYPSMLTNFDKIQNFINALSSSSLNPQNQPQRFDSIVFLTIPFFIGMIAICNFLYQGVKSKLINENRSFISKKIFLSWSYVILAVLLFSLSLPIIPINWRSRFILLAFLPIALIVPVGLKFLDRLFHQNYPTKKQTRQVIMIIVSIILAVSSFLNVLHMIPTMGPIITTEQYKELELIKKYIPEKISPVGIIHISDTQTGFAFAYWIDYVLDMGVETGNITKIVETYPGRPIYSVQQTKLVTSPFKPDFRYPWNPLLPLVEQPDVQSNEKFSENYQSKSSKAQPHKSPEFESRGFTIFQGEYLELSILVFENGTSYIGPQYTKIPELNVLLNDPLSRDMQKVSVSDLEIVGRITNKAFHATDSSTTKFIVINIQETIIPIQIGNSVQVNGTFTNHVSNQEKSPTGLWQIRIVHSRGDSIIILDN